METLSFIFCLLSRYNKKLVWSGSCLRALRVYSPINLNSEIQLLHTIFNNLVYPNITKVVDQVFSATKNKFYNALPPLDREEPLASTLVLPYNSSLKQYECIMKSSSCQEQGLIQVNDMDIPTTLKVAILE